MLCGPELRNNNSSAASTLARISSLSSSFATIAITASSGTGCPPCVVPSQLPDDPGDGIQLVHLSGRLLD